MEVYYCPHFIGEETDSEKLIPCGTSKDLNLGNLAPVIVPRYHVIYGKEEQNRVLWGLKHL